MSYLHKRRSYLLLNIIFRSAALLSSCVGVVVGSIGVFKVPDDAVEKLMIFKDFSCGFFTTWCLGLQLLFLSLALTHDALEWTSRQNSKLGTDIKYWRDVIFCGAVVPFTLFVTIMFWSIYAIDRELIYPKVYDLVVPWWFNHCVHTNITVMILIETVLHARRSPTDFKMENILYWAIGIGYAVVYYTIYFTTHTWLYQVFGVMTWWQVVLYQLLVWFGTYCFYFMQFSVSKFVHGEEKPRQEKPQEDDFVKEIKKETTETNGKVITDLKTPPFSTRSWSVKFRSLRNQFETSRL